MKGFLKYEKQGSLQLELNNEIGWDILLQSSQNRYEDLRRYEDLWFVKFVIRMSF